VNVPLIVLRLQAGSGVVFHEAGLAGAATVLPQQLF
jgi:hypothetical protein